MEELTRRRYTLESKQEAVRLVSFGQKISAAAKALGSVENAGELGEGGEGWPAAHSTWRGVVGCPPLACTPPTIYLWDKTLSLLEQKLQ